MVAQTRCQTIGLGGALHPNTDFQVTIAIRTDFSVSCLQHVWGRMSRCDARQVRYAQAVVDLIT
jgi:hypothetical protein